MASSLPQEKKTHFIVDKAFRSLNLELAFAGRPKEYSILVCGKTGVGKSALINALVGEDVAYVSDPGLLSLEEGALSTGTTEVDTVFACIEGREVRLKLTIWDSPGLEDSGNDKLYLQNMHSNCKNISIILFCIDAAISYWSSLEEITIKLMTETFGIDFWRKCLLVLTRANVIKPLHAIGDHKYFKICYKRILEKFQRDLRSNGIAIEVVDNVPGVMIGCCEERYLPFVSHKVDDDSVKQDSFLELWIQFIEMVTQKARKRFAKDKSNHSLVMHMLKNQQPNFTN